MKKFKDVYNEITKIYNRIKENETALDNIYRLDERRAAAAEKDFDAHAAIMQDIKNNAAKIAEIQNVVYLDKVTNAFLKDNAKVALYNDCKEALKEVLTKYNGKPYGEKTRDKIREELKELTGCYIWIHGNEINISYHGENPRGYTIELCKVRATTPYNNPLITDENKINAAALEETHLYEKYTENPKKAAKDLIKQREKARQALETAINLLNEYGHNTPTQIKDNTYINNPLYHTMQGI